MSYHHGNLKDALIMAAENLLDNSADFSLRQTAEQAGVSHNAPYRHFKDKEALIDAVLEKTLADLTDKISKATMIYPMSVLMQIQYVGRLIMLITSRAPERAHLLFAYRGSSDSKLSLMSSFENFKQNLIVILGESHEIQAGADLSLVAVQLVAAWRGLSAMQLSGLHRTEAFFHSEDGLFDVADSMAENILKSFMR